MAELLIQRGTDLNKSDTNGSTPLHLACKRAETNIVKAILAKDASGVNQCDFRSMSPLHHGVLSGDVEIIRLLLSHDANIGATNNRGETPLHLASGENNIEAAHILLDKGKNPIYTMLQFFIIPSNHNFQMVKTALIC